MPNVINQNERYYPGKALRRVEHDHLARYHFVSSFVKDKTVVDFGCGEGYGSALMHENGAKEVIGIDCDEEIIREAREKYHGVNFISSPGTTTTLENSSVDVVVCFEVWHHLDHYERFIPEMKRILKPGGQLICSVPNKHVIYLNPFHKTMLTEFYRYDFDKKIIRDFLGDDFEIISWYGQRFVKPLLVYFIVRLTLYMFSSVGLFRSRIDRAYKLANGPDVMELRGENARTLICIARKR